MTLEGAWGPTEFTLEAWLQAALGLIRGGQESAKRKRRGIWNWAEGKGSSMTSWEVRCNVLASLNHFCPELRALHHGDSPMYVVVSVHVRNILLDCIF